MMVKSMRGQNVDMGALLMRNANKIALGNANMNARGDTVTRDGTIIATREQVMTEYNKSSRTVRQVGLNGINSEVMLSPEEAVANARKRQQNAQLTSATPEQARSKAMTELKKSDRKISDTEI